MNAKTGKPYEHLVKAVFESIVSQEQVRNLVVQHNVILQGKHNNSHQIDVYWKFEVGGLIYENVVQVKDWKNPIDQGELLEFKGVLDDLPGQPKGIVVTRSGYQKGAREYALTHGILIYEFREADYPPPLVLTTTGWARLQIIGTPLRTIATVGETIPNVYGAIWAYEVFTPEFSNFRFAVSPNWFPSEHPTTDVTKMGELNVPSLLLHEINLYDEKRTVIGNLATIFQQVAQDVVKEGVEQKRATHTFKQPTFVGTDSLSIPYVKIDAVSVDVKIGRRQEIRRGRMKNFPQWVLRQLNSGSTDWFAVTPSVTESLSRDRHAQNRPNLLALS